MKTLTAVTLCLLLTLSVFSQSNNWSYLFDSGNADVASAQAVDALGYTYVTGYVSSPQGYHGKLIKLTTFGYSMWTRDFYGENGDWAMGKKILIDPSNSYIYVLATGKGQGTNDDFWIHKYDSFGNKLFGVRYGSALFSENFGDGILDNSGNILVTLSCKPPGDSTFNYSLLKFNSSCVMLQSQSYSTITHWTSQKLLNDLSGNIFVAGTERGTFNNQYYTSIFIHKYNPQFQLISSNGFTGVLSANNKFADAELMLNTDVILCMSLKQNSGEHDLVVLKLNNYLNGIWTKIYNIKPGKDETYSDISIDGNSNIYITGNTADCSDVITTKLNIDGNIIWNKLYNRGGNYNFSGFICTDNFGNVYCAGVSNTTGLTAGDAMILKYNPNGTLQFGYNYNGSASEVDYFSGLHVSPSGIITAAGVTTSILNNTINYNILTIRMEGNLTGITGNNSEIPESFNLSQNYPNPFNPSTKISFSLPKASFVKMVVYDITGKEVETLVNEQLSAGSFEVDFNASKLTSGAYFYRITAEGFTDVKKMILVK